MEIVSNICPKQHINQYKKLIWSARQRIVVISLELIFQYLSPFLQLLLPFAFLLLSQLFHHLLLRQISVPFSPSQFSVYHSFFPFRLSVYSYLGQRMKVFLFYFVLLQLQQFILHYCLTDIIRQLPAELMTLLAFFKFLLQQFQRAFEVLSIWIFWDVGLSFESEVL